MPPKRSLIDCDSYLRPKKTTTTTRFLHRSVEASPQTSLASRNLAFTSRPPSEPDPTALIPQLADDVPESANTFGELDVAAEEPNDEENDNVVDPALVRRQRVPLLITWLPKRDTYVDEFLRLEGREGLDDCCVGCEGESQFTCFKCFTPGLMCQSCIVSEHSTAPFHEISQWNGDFFERVSLMSLGLSIQLGHPLGEACPSPIPAFNGTFKILTFTGIVETNLNFCNCLQASTRYQQLLRARLFPATHQEPRTAATFEVLRHFQLLSFNSKVSAYEYYQTLVRLTDNVGNPIPKSYGLWMSMVRQWRHITQMKRFGRGHCGTGIKGTQEGECAVLCPACPHPGKNLPDNWEDVPPASRWLYTLFLAIDANFRLKRLDVSTDERDPSLNKGCAFFVEESKYKDFLSRFTSINIEDESTCHEYDAVKQANIRGGHGTTASGVGTIECSRHDMKRPLSVGDLQKGERYINMDYLYFSSIGHHSPNRLCVSYDIACQWRKKLVARSSIYGPEVVSDRFSQLHTTYLVPKFHLFAHRTACHIEYSFNLTPRVGRTDGESPERGWAAMNPIASSTKEMGPGSRRDTLDDHFGDYNWRKVISLHSTLLTRFEEAIEMKTAHIAAFLDFSASLSNSSVQQFSHAVWKWEQDYSQDNPFEAKVPEITQAKIRRQLADEDAAAIAQDSHIAHSDTSPRTLIAQGVEIEDQQLRLATDAAKLGPHSTEIQQTHIIERRNRLHRRIAAWRLVQQLYIPTVTPFILNDGHASDIDPECLHLYLPSAMMPSDDAEALLPPELLRLAEYEWRLRYAQGLDHLAELRRLLLLRSTMYQSKDRYSRGQYHSTRSATLLANVQARVNETRDRYRACYNALVKLSKPLKQTGWETILRRLDDNDVRSLRQGQDLSSLESEGSRQAEGFRTLSWIWSAQRPSNGSGDATANMNEALRIEWCKTRARAHRWQEECLLLHEEMRRVVQFHEYQTNIWTSRAEVVETEGKRAYALRQASIQRGLADKCRKSWSVANSRMLNPEPFVEAPMTSSIVG